MHTLCGTLAQHLCIQHMWHLEGGGAESQCTGEWYMTQHLWPLQDTQLKPNGWSAFMRCWMHSHTTLTGLTHHAASTFCQGEFVPTLLRFSLAYPGVLMSAG